MLFFGYRHQQIFKNEYSFDVCGYAVGLRYFSFKEYRLCHTVISSYRHTRTYYGRLAKPRCTNCYAHVMHTPSCTHCQISSHAVRYRHMLSDIVTCCQISSHTVFVAGKTGHRVKLKNWGW